MGCSEYGVEHVFYTQCTLLGESMLNHNRQDSGYITWLATPSQTRYFNTTNVGEEFWKRIRSVLHESAPDTAVITCFYRTAMFGFVRCYREQGDKRREDVLEALATQTKSFKLMHDAPVIIQASGPPGSKRRWRQTWIVDAVALEALWLIFSYVL